MRAQFQIPGEELIEVKREELCPIVQSRVQPGRRQFLKKSKVLGSSPSFHVRWSAESGRGQGCRAGRSPRICQVRHHSEQPPLHLRPLNSTAQPCS